jgi:histidine triad (HIT) family protein
MSCLFCDLLSGKTPTSFVARGPSTSVFLDHRPLFVGHCLLVPNQHVETFEDLDDEEVAPLFLEAKRLCRAVREALEAEGTFVAVNNRVSQSVPHLHVHVVPRRKGDGLRGFFWPRSKYSDAAHLERVRAAIAERLAVGRRAP